MTALGAAEYLAHQRRAATKARLEIPEFVLPVSRHVIVGRMRIHYLDWGDPGGSPILFLHGGGLTAHTWDLVCLDLRGDYRCVASDLRGHGDSEWSPELDYGIASHAEDAIGLADALSWERFTIVGMSLGGLAAMSVAAREPERVRALVIVDVGPTMRQDAVGRIQRHCDRSLRWAPSALDNSVVVPVRRDAHRRNRPPA